MECVGSNGLPTAAMGQALRSTVSTIAATAVHESIAREARRIDDPVDVEDGSGTSLSFEELLVQLALEEEEPRTALALGHNLSIASGFG